MRTLPPTIQTSGRRTSGTELRDARELEGSLPALDGMTSADRSSIASWCRVSPTKTSIDSGTS